MKHQMTKRMLAVLLTIAMMVSCFAMLSTVSAAEKTYVVVAGSDFQNKSCTTTNYTAGTNAVKALLAPIESYLDRTYGNHQADGFLFCGDYYKDNGSVQGSTNGLNALKNTVSSELGSGVDALYVQGNHDVSGVPYDTSGAHDAEGYGVYEMNWDEYNGYSASYSAAQTMANNLRTYFAARKANHPDQPVFIIAHQPLHAGPRTIWGDSYNNCALYAMPIFEAINEAAEDLNIIYLFGHNHSKDFDSYLGGSSIFLTEGDTILISNATSSSGRKVSSFTEQTLNFTYMNPGYVGYYDSYSDADDSLTMSLFEINGSAVTITRYDADGVHVLKAAGDHTDCTTERGTEMNNFVAKYQPDTRVVNGPVTVGYSEPEPDEQTFIDPDTGISVTTRYGSRLIVTLLPSTTAYDTIDDYRLYNVEVEGFVQGKTATVTIPVPDSFAGSRMRVYYVDENGELSDYNATITDSTATFTTNHFSKYMLASMNSDMDSLNWVTIPGESTYTYTLDTDGIDIGEKYLIVAPSNAYALVGTSRQEVTVSGNTVTTDTNAYEWAIDNVEAYNGTSISCSSTSYTLSNPTNYYYQVADGDYRQITSAKCTRSGGTLSRRYAWTINYEGGIAKPTTQSVTLYTKSNGYTFEQDGKYLYINGSSLAVNAASAPWTIANGTTSGQYRLTNNGRNIRYNSGFTTSTSNYYVRMYRLTDTVTIPGGYAALSGPAEYSVAVGETPTLTNKVWFKESEDAEPVQVDYDFGSVDTSTAGDKTIHVNYLGQDLGTITVHVKNITVTDISVSPMNGEVYLKAKPTAQTGSTLTVTYSDGSVKTIPMTLEMLSGDFDVRTVGEYPDLTVNYMGQSISGYTLTVLGNDYPEYPNEGSVKVDKNGNGIDFTSTGVAKINLSTVGVPMNQGVDVIVMLDTSSSMTRDATNTSTTDTSKQRITMLKNSLVEMTEAFQTPNADGTLPDIRMAIADFNGFTYLTGTSAVDYISQQNYDQKPTMHVYTGNGQLNAGAFVDVNSSDFNITAINNALTTTQGTNYDEAFDRVYKLGTAILEKNAAEGEDRDLVVIFMSDGASFQYNYFHSRNTEAAWATWLDGSIDMNSSAVHGTHTYFKNGDANEHRMANAIKGSPDELYEVIRPDNTYGTPAGQDYMYNVPGLGATMYTIGFCITEDGSVPQNTIKANIERLATVEDGESLFYDANNQQALNAAFTGIADKLKQAATGAYFVDSMGADYDLQMSTKNYTVGGKSKTIAPTITVTEYDAYKRSDIGKTVNGVLVTEAMVGKTYGSGTVKETVTFNADGTEAYSDKLEGNILRNGVICAKNFYYNTKTEPVTVDGIIVPAESFHWIIGAITEKVMNLSYYVYLTGSMEGTHPEGSYPTNSYADLHYINYLGHDAVKHTVSPILPWGSAHVSYAFYLVDDNGKPVVNRTTGETGSFTNRVVMTNPTVYGTIYLNSGSEIDNIEVAAKTVLPDGYVLYNDSASYEIKVTSDGNGSNWKITDSSGTTYVTDYNGNDYTNLDCSESSVDYTHTTVWFAMKYTIKAIPDTVVIDYGLSVDINVLANDMFGTNGTLVAVGSACPESSYTPALADGFAETYTGSHGTAELNGSKVRYTPADMKMDSVETFAYAVRYTGNGLDRYFYSTVTVVPAANMYFEESFVSFDGAWENAGTMDDALQSEDRPGTYTLGEYDANNVYGYDPAYSGYTTYSYGAAKKVTVSTDYYNTHGAWPNATFTFTGSRFDLISMTSKATGFIRVEVYEGTEAVGTPVAKWAVDTYYGYTAAQDSENPWLKLTYTYNANDGKWHSTGEPVAEKGTDASTVVPANPKAGDTYIMYRENYIWTVTDDDNALYQVPVIRSTDLGYGTYTAVITPCYAPLFDHTGAESYDFYLDSVRIYGPAQGLDETYYTQDGEGWPQYINIRKNLLDQNSFVVDGSGVDGAVFIDGFATEGTIAQYEPYGPNNEVYLQQGQAVAFILSDIDTANVDTVQIGMKSLNGSLAKAEIIGLNKNGSLSKSEQVATATEMFYRFGSCIVWDKEKGQSNILIVRNTTSAILSLTNVKVTYKADPNAKKTKMQINLTTANAAAKYVQEATCNELLACDHLYTVSVTHNPTAAAAGTATVTCSFCSFSETFTLPALNESDYSYQLVSEPTCTLSGLAVYTMALDPYGEAVVRIALPAAGHRFETSADVTPNTSGDVALTCTVCGITLVNDDVDPIAPDAALPDIKSAYLRLGNDITIVYAAEIPAGYVEPFMEFTMSGKTYPVMEYTIDDAGRYCFEFRNITPQHMGDNISAVLHVNSASGEYTDTVGEYSVKQYCQNLLAKSSDDAALAALLSDLLTYGAAAQKYCGYNTDTLVTDGLTLTPSAYAPDSDYRISFSGESDASADWKSASLILCSDLAIRFAFTAESIEDLQVRISINGRELTLTAEEMQRVPGKENVWYVDYYGILASELADTVSASFYRSGDKIGRTVNYSVNAYICAVLNGNISAPNLTELMQALYNYGVTAQQYAEAIRCGQ